MMIILTRREDARLPVRAMRFGVLRLGSRQGLKSERSVRRVRNRKGDAAVLELPAISKLIDYIAAGVGGIAGPLLAPWAAGRRSKAAVVEAQGQADAQRILAASEAHQVQTISQGIAGRIPPCLGELHPVDPPPTAVLRGEGDANLAEVLESNLVPVRVVAVGIGRVDGDIRAELHRLGLDGRLHQALVRGSLVVGPAGVELPDVYAAERE